MKRGIPERILNDEKLAREISYVEYSVSEISVLSAYYCA